ncbi:uncharacterized protein BT62DRAFT_67947 [Guyanagaster necrorhizus]|uniref:DUF6534 domain-containing protein n=1 Tax=Guyanagaster necrorhizus TaxID=856835 RepID=A0A9P7VUP0_9AGAR|nr:uncharacterized protein BT62DRAFT_67947 [Guyanagaster necrorhizus MCA 3950]KAG7447197.1 hypothetical protein BT62DRAFT_67947 [Guyanagaster necrorhizus MCA 3950]
MASLASLQYRCVRIIFDCFVLEHESDRRIDIYYIHFNSKDDWRMRLYVWFIFLLEIVFTIFSTIAAWDQYGPGWGDVNSILLIDWSWEPLPSLNGTISAMVQTFYVWRIYNLTKNIWISLVIEVVAIVQCTFAWYFGISVSVGGLGVDKLIADSPEVSTWLAGSAACDVMITATIVSVLYRANKQSKFSQTTSAVTKIIRFSVETGLLTSAAAVAELILWLTQSEYNIHFIGFLVLGKLYSNALVATLNSRALIFGSIHTGAYTNSGSSGSAGPRTSNPFWDEGTKSQTRSLGTRSQTVHVTRTTEIHDDDSHEMIVVI